MAVPAKKIKEALIKKRGVMAAAAKMVGLSRVQVWNRVNKSKMLQEALKEARDSFVDDGESALVKAVGNNEAWAISLLLKTLGKDRGYVEKQDIGLTGDLTIEVVKFADENKATK